MENSAVAKAFRDLARMLEIKGENIFRIRAYERAAQNIEGLTESLFSIAAGGSLTDIPGIGKDLSDKIKELLATGSLKMLEDLKKSVPEGLLELLEIPSVGPKTAKLLHEELKIKDIPSLEEAIRNGGLRGIEGIKEKTIQNILKGIEIVKRGKERMTLAQAQLICNEFISPLIKMPEVNKISPAGSLRRQKETVRDIDILVISGKPKKVIGAFTKLAPVKDILASGETKASIRTKDDVQVDCRVVERNSFGAALLYFTGSKNFNIKIRKLAIKNGFKVNEYGIFKGNKFIAGGTEEEIFKALKMSYIEPELREDTGEIELAQKFSLPKLIELKDIKGDLHAHSLWSDGSNTIEEMAQGAKELGLSYIAITDHSQSLKIAGGLSPEDLKKKRREIEKINKKLKGFRVLHGTEADIDSEGNIDYPEGILKEFDIVVAAIHTGFKQPRKQLTKRMVKACKNKYVHIIAHPTARLWGVREAYDIDLKEALKAAKETNTNMEINSFPQRLDLNDVWARQAKEIGVKLSIGTDSHEAPQLNSLKYGISVARRAWLAKNDVINTLPAEELLKSIKK